MAFDRLWRQGLGSAEMAREGRVGEEGPTSRQQRKGEAPRIHLPPAGLLDPLAEAFDRPDSFDIFRTGSAHVAFGFGIHFCPGAALARLETRCTLEVFFNRCAGVEPAYDDVELLGSLIVRGPKALPIAAKTA